MSAVADGRTSGTVLASSVPGVAAASGPRSATAPQSSLGRAVAGRAVAGRAVAGRAVADLPVLGAVTYRPGRDLLRASAGEPTVLSDAAVDLVEFANAELSVDLHRDPASYTVAEMVLSWFHRRAHDERVWNGDRLKGVESNLRRYLLPFVMEFAVSSAPTGPSTRSRRPGQVEMSDLPVATVGQFSVLHAEHLASMLAGDRPLPAATVAGDLLGRSAVRCVWLSLEDAGAVCDGGLAAVELAVRSGTVSAHRTSQGEVVISAVSLRAVGLLREPGTVHGRAGGTATHLVFELAEAMERARVLGVPVSGDFTSVHAIEPVNDRRRSLPRARRSDVSIVEVVDLCVFLPPIHQVAVWCARLTGMRMGEVFGLDVSDYERGEGERIGWLSIETQGGRTAHVRSKDTGKVEKRKRKDGVKTPKSERRIPIGESLCDLLDELIRVFHTDRATGLVDLSARLIPGLRSENDSGSNALHTRLRNAKAAGGPDDEVVYALMHDMRHTVITDLRDLRVEDRLAEAYTGHEPSAKTKTVHDGYDGGPSAEDLIVVAEAMEELLREGLRELGDVNGLLGRPRQRLQVPTAKSSQWGRTTTRGQQRDLIKAELVASGWQVQHGVEERAAVAELLVGMPLSGPVVENSGVLDGAAVLGASDVLDVGQAAAVLQQAPSTVRRAMRTGALAAHQASWGSRLVWVAYRKDVEAYRASLDSAASVDRTLASVAQHLGRTRHQVWTTANKLGLLDDAVTFQGQKHLSVRSHERLVDALRTRERWRSLHLSTLEASSALNLGPELVQTLVRRGDLAQVADPDGGSRRYVTRASVDAYNAKYPPACAAHAGSQDHPGDGSDSASVVMGVALLEARALLGITRHECTHLVASRKLVEMTCRRRRFLKLDSAVAFATDAKTVAALEAAAVVMS